MTHALSRYDSIVDDPQAFTDAAFRPLPRAVWVNSLRGNSDAIAAKILERCPEAMPISWRPHAFRLPSGAMPGKWPEFAMGLIHVQEEISLWPVMVLAPKPGERVLDLCASPGNKTAHIALEMQDRGMVVANELNTGRASALAELMSRLGLVSVVTTLQDGRRFAGQDGWFDRVLVDAPCTCEGTSRKSRGKTRNSHEIERQRIVEIQKALLTRGLQLTRPGGTVVYSTCTYAPEENEGVLSAIDPTLACVEPLAIPEGLLVSPGLLAWEGKQYRPDVALSARIWPHHNDTGGFFVARLRRL